MSEQEKPNHYFLFLITIIVSCATFVASLAPFANPVKYWFIAIAGLGFFYCYLTNLFFLFFWIIKKNKTAFISLIPFLLGLTTAFSFIRIKSADEKVSSKKMLDVMTYNVRIFDLYNWTHNQKTRNKIFNFLKKENPDVLCMQEFHSSTNAPFHNLDTLQQILRAKNVHLLLPVFLYGTDYWGVATFTSYPIIKKQTVFADANSANGCIATDIKVGNDTLRIYNAHLQSIRFTGADYNYVKDIEEKNTEEQFKGIKGIVKRLKKAFVIRAGQTEIIAQHISQCPYNIIVCGDFNDTPASYTYRIISNSLSDSFKNKGNGLSTTYIGIFPAFRIDYILHSTAFKTMEYKVPPEKFTDHYAVRVKLDLSK